MSTNVRIHIDRRFSFADGLAFGDVGAYERLVGRAEYAVDPTDPRLAHIVDLELAPRNADGLVEFSGVIDIIKPVDFERGNHRLLYEASNRGNRSLLRSFNEAPGSSDPTTAEHAGNGFLMRRGYTIVWSGWQGDLVPADNFITVTLPEARRDGQSLGGRVRQEFIVDRAGVLSMPVSGGANIQCYPVLDRSTVTLTEREHEQDPRQPVPDDRWQLAKAVRDTATGEVTVTPSSTDLYLLDGFKPGWIYEMTYDTAGSRVMGLGLAGVRDLIAFLRYEDEDADGGANPLAGKVEKAYAYGASLSARVVREFVYQGFNESTDGERVFDAVYPHLSGGGRVWVNQRFAQVGRYPRQHEEHQWASERYPFAYSETPDIFSEKLDSVLKHPGSDPLFMHTHSSTEYWQRHASLGQSDLATGADLEIPDGVRMYYLAGFPHGAAAPSPSFIGQQEPNGLASAPFLRACLELMDRWATDGVAPPPTRLPNRTDGTLAPPDEVLASFPKLPGVNLPKSSSRLPFYNYGPDFDRGVITQHPPEPVPGQEYGVQVPRVDADGNDQGGVRCPDLEAPLGTYTGWNLRKAGFAEGDLLSLNGSFIPFARTRAEREAKGDPRLSIEERYSSHDAYLQAVTLAVQRLVADRLLLEEDAERFIKAARERNPLDPSVPLQPLIRAGGAGGD
jgi:hypothetical protein